MAIEERVAVGNRIKTCNHTGPSRRLEKFLVEVVPKCRQGIPDPEELNEVEKGTRYGLEVSGDDLGRQSSCYGWLVTEQERLIRVVEKKRLVLGRDHCSVSHGFEAVQV